jgi:hypothetical protein
MPLPEEPSESSQLSLSDPFLPDDAPLTPTNNAYRRSWVAGQSWTLRQRILFVVGMCPFIGSILFYFAITGRVNRMHVRPGRGDSLVIAFVGLMFQLALAVPLVFVALNDDAKHHLVTILDSSADYYAPLVVYAISDFYFVLISLVFLVYEERQRRTMELQLRGNRRGYDTIPANASSAHIRVDESQPATSIATLSVPNSSNRSRLTLSGAPLSALSKEHMMDSSSAMRIGAARSPRLSQQQQQQQMSLMQQHGNARKPPNEDEEDEAVVIRELSDSTVFNVAFIIPVGLVLGALQTAVLRVCSWNGSAPCKDSTFSFGIELYRADVYYRLATVFWLAIWSVLVISCCYGVCISFQELRQLEEFTYIDSTKSRMLSKLVADLLQPRKLHAWVNIFHRVLEAQKGQALSQAVMGPTAFCVIFTTIGAATYVVMDNVANDQDVAEFTSGCIFAAIFAFCCSACFIVITVRMQKLVEFQALVISKVQSDVQHQVDEYEGLTNGISSGGAKATMAKIRALQALGLYIRLAESKPKIMGMSLETVRWATIFLGLFFLNAGFFILYVKNCYS